MKFYEVQNVLEHLSKDDVVIFKTMDGVYVSSSIHLTEVGLIHKYFMDCGGVKREKKFITFQLWQGKDQTHRISTQKFLDILRCSRQIWKSNEFLDIEVEYQQASIGKFGLDFDGDAFVLTSKQTGCLAKSSCRSKRMSLLSS